MSTNSEAELKIIERVQKLLELASKNPSKEEADSARAKAQQLMTEWNLDQATIEQASGVASGKREEVRTKGGFYQWQRELYEAIAELNFCLYWTEIVWVPATYKHAYVGQKMRKRQHRLVGRMVNTRAAMTMAEYLEKAIEDALEEAIHGSDENKHSNYAHTFRMGAAEELMHRIGERYRDRIQEEKLAEVRAKRNAAEVAGKDASTSTAVTLSSYVKSEKAANDDFIYGEGYSARQAAAEAQAAADRRKRIDDYTKWAKEHPKEAAENRKRWEKVAAREARAEARAEDRKYSKVDWGAYRRGKEAGRSISIDQQVGGRKTKGLLK